ncbi:MULTISPECIES: SH3 domain-containing protein [Niastella]|uniref:SH3 domain-containing protein n=1 Tax=Niastella soli TaxID=2821487 RepID=A0ABS3Z223_9BACT|nr:SH3 domain-containing protein [Niastella soli]MBO9204209.1 SH3 domain-containing protein [Niastella soli]
MIFRKPPYSGTLTVSSRIFFPFLFLQKSNLRKLFLCALIICHVLIATGQSYLGAISKQVNFREGPGSEYKTISSLKPGTQIFIVSLETEYDFYNIIDIRTNKTGYVHKSFVTIGKQLPKSEDGLFTPNGSTEDYESQIEIFNNTSLTLTLKLNSQFYSFTPKEKRNIALSPTTYNFIASAPGVIPNYGTETLQSNTKYTWQFYIVTRRR